jgi:hypothetical protein
MAGIHSVCFTGFNQWQAYELYRPGMGGNLNRKS